MTILYKTARLFPTVSREADLSLLEGARQMKREALVQIFDLYSPALYNYAFRLCNDPILADYIVGDVFAKLLEQLAAGKGPTANLRSYLYEMAYHLVVDEARSNHRGAPIEAVDLVENDSQSSYVSLENRILFETILRVIRNDLTDDQRHVIILRFLEGFNLQETAAIIGKEVSNVKVIQNRAITALRKALDAKEVK